MKEDFDRDLSKHIVRTFEDYGDGRHEEGWMLLRKKYPEKKRRSIAWWWYAAALSGLIVTAGLWLGNEHQKLKRAIVTAHSTKHSHKHPEIMDRLARGRAQSAITLVLPPQAFKPNHAVRNSQTAPLTRLVGQHRNFKRSNDVKATGHPEKIREFNKDSTPFNTLRGKTLAAVMPAPESTMADTDVLASNSEPQVIKQPEPAARIDNLKPLDKTITNGEKNIVQKKTTKQPVTFGLYAATYYNYAKGSDNELNIGAGIASDIKLFGNLILSTGIAVGKNSLNYRSELPQSNAVYTTFSSIALNATGAKNQTFQAQSQSYTARLMAVDIPLNLKYQFNGDSYLAAGISSGTYFNESYSYDYSYGAPFTSSVSGKQSNSANNFSTFDLAKTLNFSFGIGYPIGKATRIVVEPFLKYPLAGLGAQQLKFGAGGVNLKLNLLKYQK
jgi:hypothetical protein